LFFVLSKLLDVALSPLTWAIVLCLLGAIAVLQKSPRRGMRAAPLAAACVLYVFSIEPVSNALARRLEAPAVPTARANVTYDAVILLGGLVDSATGAFGQRSYNDNVERLLVTFDLLRAGRAKFAILSGGPVEPEAGEASEARVLAAQLSDWGIAKEQLVVEDRARNTRENAVESARIVRDRGWTKVLVVTSAFHMPRALECFNAVGLQVDTLPVDRRALDLTHRTVSYLPRSGALNQSTNALRELAGRLIYRMQGYGASELRAPRLPSTG
jgi:uncharacterized SAM-binding protein YcdF (DUF218 family)